MNKRKKYAERFWHFRRQEHADPTLKGDAQSARDIIQYFETLSYGKVSIGGFNHMWQKMAGFDFSKSKLINILNNVAGACQTYPLAKKVAIKENLRASPATRAFFEKLLPHISDFTPREMAETLYQLGELGLFPPKSFVRAYLSKFDEAVKYFTASQLAQTMESFRNLDWDISETSFKAWEEASLPYFSDMPVTPLAFAARICARKGIKPDPRLTDAWMKQSLSCMAHTSLDSGSAVSIIDKIHSLSLTPSKEFLKSWQEGIKGQLHTLDPKALVLVLTLFTRHRLRPEKEFMDEWQQSAIRHMSRFGYEELRDSISSVAKLGLAPDDNFMSKWSDRAQHKYFNPNALALSVWSLAIISASRGFSQLDDIADTLFAQLKQKKLDVAAQRQVNSAALRFGKPEFFRQNPASEETGSGSEKRLQTAFEKADVKFADTFIPCLDRHVDFCIESDGRKIRIEFDGPTHFIEDAEGYLYPDGSSKLRNVLLPQLDPKGVLICADYVTHDEIINNRGSSGYVRQLTRAFKWATSGVYQTDIDPRGDLILVPILQEMELP